MKTNAIGIERELDVQGRFRVYSFHSPIRTKAEMLFWPLRNILDHAAEHLIKFFGRIPQFLLVLTKRVFLNDGAHSKLVWIRHTERNFVRHGTLLEKCHLPDSVCSA